MDALNAAYSSVGGVLFNKSQTTLIQCPGGKAGSVTVPNSVATIEDLAFDSCTSLTAIEVGALNSTYSSAGGVLFNKSQTTLIRYPGGKAGSYAVPNSITNIGSSAFSACANLTDVAIGNHVAYIRNSTFSRCASLVSVTIGNRVSLIGNGAFAVCPSLESLWFQGNAPSCDSTAFSGTDNATVYYLPGTTGWDTTFAGRPTALWNLPVQPNIASSGVRTNRFGFAITGTSEAVFVVEACTDLANPSWSAVATNTLGGGSSYFSDPQWRSFHARFYRLRSP